MPMSSFNQALQAAIETYFPGTYHYSESRGELMVEFKDKRALFNINEDAQMTAVEVIAQMLLGEEESDEKDSTSFFNKIMEDATWHSEANRKIVLSAISQMENGEREDCLGLFIKHYYDKDDLKTLHRLIAFDTLSFETKLIYIGLLYDVYNATRKKISADERSITHKKFDEFTIHHQIISLWDNLKTEIESSLKTNHSENKKLICDFENKAGHNLLILTAACCPEAVPDMIKCAEDRPDKLDELLTHRYDFGTNALMIACSGNIEAVKAILKAARSNVVLKKMLLAKTILGIGPVFFALKNTDHVKALLDAANLLPDEDKTIVLKDMLMAKTNKKVNALMIAARYAPETVQPLLDAAKDKEEVLKDMLMAKNNGGWNALMIAARYAPKTVQPLLDAAKDKEEVLKDMLMAKNNGGWNALMIAARNAPKTVQPLLDAAKDKEEVLKDMLMAKNNEGWRAESLAEESGPVKILAAARESLINNQQQISNSGNFFFQSTKTANSTASEATSPPLSKT